MNIWVNPLELNIVDFIQPHRSQTEEERDSLMNAIQNNGFDEACPVHLCNDSITIIQGWNRTNCALILGLEKIPAVVHEDISPRDHDKIKELSLYFETVKTVGRTLSLKDKQDLVKYAITHFPTWADSRIAHMLHLSVSMISSHRKVLDPEYINRPLITSRGTMKKPLSQTSRAKPTKTDEVLDHLNYAVKYFLDTPEKFPKINQLSELSQKRYKEFVILLRNKMMGD